MYICICKGITDNDIRNAIADGAQSYACVRKQLGISSQCGQCGRDAKNVVNEALSERSTFRNAEFYAA